MAAAKSKSSDRQRLPVYVVFGKDNFLRGETLKGLLNELIGDLPPETVLAEFDGATAQLANVLDECRTFSLLAPFRVVCVKAADEFVTRHRESIEKYVLSPSDSGVLILVCNSWPKTTRLYKAVEALGGNLDCNPPTKPAELAAWVSRRAMSEFGCRISSGCAAQLVDLVGEDFGRLYMELHKLATYVAPRKEIGEQDVEELVAASRADKVFKVTDAIAMRDAAKALDVWDLLLATERAAPYMAIGGLAFAFRRLAEAKRLSAQGMPPFSVAKATGFFGPPEAMMQQIRRFSLRQWQDFLVKLLRIDVGSKRSKTTVPIGVEKFIVESCATK